MEDERVKRKARSMEILKEHNVYCYPELPCIETSNEVTTRTKEEIARRAMACFFSVQFACDLTSKIENIEESKEILEGLIQRYGVEENLTNKEKALFRFEGDQQDAIDMVWKYEGFWVLIWALGFVDELNFPTEICDVRFCIDLFQRFENVDEMIENAELRDIADILDEADLIFRYDWNCVNARINNRMPDSGLDSSVVLERHRALNWLIECADAEDWDNVAAHT